MNILLKLMPPSPFAFPDAHGAKQMSEPGSCRVKGLQELSVDWEDPGQMLNAFSGDAEFAMNLRRLLVCAEVLLSLPGLRSVVFLPT